MRFLLDQDVYIATLHFVQELGHDAIPAAQLGLGRVDIFRGSNRFSYQKKCQHYLAKANDTNLLNEAHELDRILITRDKDFGGMVFVSGLGAGVIYLRMMPSTRHVVHQELARVINSYS